MYRSRVGLGLVACMLAVLAAGCAAAPPAAPEPSALKHVSVYSLPYLSFAPIEMAQRSGLFEKHGLEVAFVDLPGDTEATLALGQGQLDVSAGFITPGVLQAIAASSDIRIVADKSFLDPRQGCSVNAVVAASALVESGALDTPEGWNDLLVSYTPESIEGLAFETALGLQPSDPTPAEPLSLPAPAELDAFNNGGLDATFTSEPWVTQLTDQTDTQVWRGMEMILPDAQYGVILFGPTLLRDDPEIGRAFIAAYLEAVHQYQLGKTDENIAALNRITDIDPDLLRRLCWPSFQASGRINVETVQAFQSWAQAHGWLETTLSPEQFWDSTFVDAAAATNSQ